MSERQCLAWTLDLSILELGGLPYPPVSNHHHILIYISTLGLLPSTDAHPPENGKSSLPQPFLSLKVWTDDRIKSVTKLPESQTIDLNLPEITEMQEHVAVNILFCPVPSLLLMTCDKY